MNNVGPDITTKQVADCTPAELYEYATLVMAEEIHGMAKEKGFWNGGAYRNKYEMFVLMHSELSEGVEAMRKCKTLDMKTGGPPDIHDVKDDKLTDESAVAVELADCVVRILDFCAGFGINLGDVLAKKVAYNAKRPHMHGKNA